MAKNTKQEKNAYRTTKIDKPEPYEYILPIKTSKDKDRIIKRIERHIRSSMEYRDYIQFLRDYADMKRCAFFQGVSNEGGENKKVKIEIHHEPFTLRDYVETVLTKHMETGRPINEMYIADEVMEIHYLNQVGLIPLSKTMHQVMHKSNKVKIPMYILYGNYAKFLQDYEDYISDEMMEKLERKIDETKAIKEDSFSPIEKKFTYLEIDGFSLPQLISDEEEAIA